MVRDLEGSIAHSVHGLDLVIDRVDPRRRAKPRVLRIMKRKVCALAERVFVLQLLTSDLL
jgi:hypothetical protein